jgi:hypothetical protein
MSKERQVINQIGLSAYMAKRTKWFSWYDVSKEPNSIQNQINLMIFSEMSYRVLRQERDRNLNSGSDVPAVNYLIDSGYFSTQILAIRKLLDPGSDVLSLNRVIKDLKKSKSLITREVFVSYDDTTYEPGMPTTLVPGLQPEDSPFSQWSRSTRRHHLFDRLSGVSIDERSREDLIRDEVFSKLEGWIKSSGAKELILICNKYLAHAADASSRGDLVIGKISFEQVEAVQRIIVRVSKAIFDLILTSGVYSPIAVLPPLGFFGTVWGGEGMASLVPTVERMNSDWDELEKDRNRWSFGLEHDLLG